ncbi:MAG: hypothetical protein Fur006_69510 [Coleofasciculaceae cyanobacterium]
MWTGNMRSALRFTRFAITIADPASRVQQQEEDEAEPRPIHISYGYSRDHRPDLKQFVMDLICTGDGDVHS